VDSTPPDPSPDLTTRERFAEHTEDVVCASCHQLIDPIGLGFENYDGVGRFQAEENGFMVDASGAITGAGDADGPFNGAVELSQRLSSSATARDCAAAQWFDYALGRRALPADNCSQTAVETAFASASGNIPELMEAIALSNSFRFIQLGAK
jgi:hypothetical protein